MVSRLARVTISLFVRLGQHSAAFPLTLTGEGGEKVPRVPRYAASNPSPSPSNGEKGEE